MTKRHTTAAPTASQVHAATIRMNTAWTHFTWRDNASEARLLAEYEDAKSAFLAIDRAYNTAKRAR